MSQCVASACGMQLARVFPCDPHLVNVSIVDQTDTSSAYARKEMLIPEGNK